MRVTSGEEKIREHSRTSSNMTKSMRKGEAGSEPRHRKLERGKQAAARTTYATRSITATCICTSPLVRARPFSAAAAARTDAWSASGPPAPSPSTENPAALCADDPAASAPSAPPPPWLPSRQPAPDSSDEPPRCACSGPTPSPAAPLSPAASGTAESVPALRRRLLRRKWAQIVTVSFSTG